MLIDRRTLVIGTAAWAGLGGLAGASEADDMTIGSPDARVHLVEYASLTCPHCAAFHEANWTTLKTDYIDTGRVKLTLREILTPPAELSLAMFQVARCGDADPAEYFDRVAALFQRQRAIFDAGSGQVILGMLVAAGAEWGLSETQVMASISDQTSVARAQRVSEAANQLGVTGTPTFFLNGQRVTDQTFHQRPGLVRILDAALGA